MSELEHDLIAHFLKGLAHKLRTPLSVVSNDLSYYKTLLPDEDLSRSISRCREVSDILKLANSIVSSGNVSRGNVWEVLTEVFGDRDSFRVEGQESLEFEFSKRALEAASRELLLLLESDFVLSGLVLQKTERKLLFQGESKQGAEPASAEYKRLTDYFCIACGRDSFTAPLIDSVFLRYGIELELSISQKLKLELLFPKS